MWTHVFRLLTCLALASALTVPLRAQCAAWTPGLARAGAPNGPTDTAVFDDGGGERLYACGWLPRGANFQGYVSRWTGTFWEPIYDLGIGPSTVVYHLGAGTVGGIPYLFAARSNVVMAWDGATWTNLGTAQGAVNLLQVLDDGTGPALYIAGSFTAVNGVPMARVAKWNGATWSGFGAGPTLAPNALVFFQTGSTLELHAATSALNGQFSPCVQRFDGTSWSPLGSNLLGAAAFAIFDPGSGPELYLGTIQGLKRWSGTDWTSVIPGGTERTTALTVADLGSGPALYMLGAFAGLGSVPALNIGRFDGANFSALGSGFTPLSVSVFGRISVLHEGSATKLVARAAFTTAGGLRTESLALWDGASWSVLGAGFNGSVNSLASWDMGGGEQLYAAGEFTRAGGAYGADGGVARWNGSAWNRIGDFGEFVYAIAGSNTLVGPRVFVTGRFDVHPYWSIAAWDGSAWSAVGGGLHGDGFALIEHDDGSGARLFAGGNFALAQSGPGERVAAWNGATWDPLGGGTNNIVSAFARFDEGGGLRLFAGGTFTTAGGQPANRIARWDGASWTPLGTGMANGGVNALCAFAGELYAGGTFTTAGGALVNYLARWDGATWSNVPGGGANGGVTALHVHDDGRGPALYVAGSFNAIGGITAYNLARFDGATWEPVDGGTDGIVRTFASLDDDGDGDLELFAGGEFVVTGTVSSGNVGRLAGCPHYTSFCFGDGSLADHTTACPCGNDGAPGRGCASGANAGGALLAASGSTQQDDVVLAGSGFPATAYGLYLQHDAQDDRVFHDGVLCAGGNLLRLRNRTASGGVSQFPDPAFPVDATTTLAQRGFVTPGNGATRYYSVFYRSPAATFCPPATANVTNGVRIVW